jgi:hypothetical protein
MERLEQSRCVSAFPTGSEIELSRGWLGRLFMSAGS